MPPVFPLAWVGIEEAFFGGMTDSAASREGMPAMSSPVPRLVRFRQVSGWEWLSFYRKVKPVVVKTSLPPPLNVTLCQTLQRDID